jgi:hypothetical protein
MKKSAKRIRLIVTDTIFSFNKSNFSFIIKYLGGGSVWGSGGGGSTHWVRNKCRKIKYVFYGEISCIISLYYNMIEMI